ncbi:hypothetical protein D3C81_1322720 [compost metagenome]
MERYNSTRLIRNTNFFHIIQGLTNLVLLLIDLSITMNLGLQKGRQRIHTGNPNTMQTTRNLVCIFIKFTSGVQYCHYKL